MVRGSFIHRPNDFIDKRAIDESRRVIDESIQVLETHPPPDTFLGRRQTREPVPLPDDEQ